MDSYASLIPQPGLIAHCPLIVYLTPCKTVFHPFWTFAAAGKLSFENQLNKEIKFFAASVRTWYVLQL
jgi:hypothetical protein